MENLTNENRGAFIRMLQEMAGGIFSDQLDRELQTLLRDMHAKTLTQGKTAGELTIKLKIASDGNAVLITPDVAVKAPKPSRPLGTFFFGKNSNLQTESNTAKQPNLRGTEAPRGNLRTVTTGANTPKVPSVAEVEHTDEADATSGEAAE